MSTLRSSVVIKAFLLATLTLAVSAQAAVLTYPLGYSQDDDNPDLPAGTAGGSVSSTYGDNITQADIDAGYYGAAGGPTPDVLVWNDYENVYVKVSDDGYGDLPSVLCSTYGWYMIELKTSNNYLIDLHGFNMAARTDEGAQISVDILIDGQMVKRIEPFVYGKAGVDGIKHIHFDTSDAEGEGGVYGFGPIAGRHIGIRVWPNPLGEDVGITNIHFSQREDFQAYAADPAPETVDVSLATTSLSWASHDDVEYDVWFGASSDLTDVTPIRTTESTLGVDQTALEFGALDPNMAYFWRVDTVQADGAVTEGAVWLFDTVAGQAGNPVPLSAAINQSGLNPQLAWTGPEGWEHVEATYLVYLAAAGEDLALVSPETGLSECGLALDETLLAATDYSWRVDTVVHGQTFAGSTWSFATAGLKATCPLPADEGEGLPGSKLRWVAGATAQSHRVYFSMDENLTESDLLGTTEETGFTLVAPLEPEQVNFWRVDEVTEDGGVVSGNTWQFTVENLPVDGLIVALTPQTALTNGSCVENWRDLSGRDNDALMYDQPTRPWLVNSSVSEAIVDFDGEDDHLVIGSNPEDFGRNTFTWYVVGIPMRASDTMAMISSGYQGGSCWGWLNRLWGTAWEDSTWITWVKSPGKVSVVSNDTPEKLAIVSGVWDGDNLWQYVNSVCAEGLGSGSTGDPESHQFTLLGSGFAQPGKGNYLNGQIAEVLVYNRTLRPEEKSVVDSYLAAKYGIVADIPMNPSPPNRSKHVDLELTLTWDGPAGATYDVFFKEVEASDWTQLASGIPETEVVLPELASPIVLDYEKTYQWRVDTWRNGVRFKGPEWSFDTWVPYCSEPIPGDLNDDCQVDVQDLMLMLENWLQSN